MGGLRQGEWLVWAVERYRANAGGVGRSRERKEDRRRTMSSIVLQSVQHGW